MGAFRVEVVTRAVEVGRHDRDKAGAVLAVVGPAHGDAGDLGHGVRLVGRLEFAVQEILLAQRLGGKLGIDTGAAEEKQFLDGMQVALVDDICLDGQVVVDKFGGAVAVGQDTAHPGRSEEDVHNTSMYVPVR